MPSWAEHACHVVKKATKVGVMVGGFDVDHRVERFVRKRQVLGIARKKSRPGS